MPADSIEDWSKPSPGGRCVCGDCGSTLIAKCGSINVWHWAHESGSDCDPWHEHETDWHLRLKEICLERWQGAETEKTIHKNGSYHRADIFLWHPVPDLSLVIELQHSSISPTEIQEREAFYGRMVWIFDVCDIAGERFFLENRETHYVFQWNHAKKSLLACSCPVILHYQNSAAQDRFFVVKKRYKNFKYGWGYLYETIQDALEETSGVL